MAAIPWRGLSLSTRNQLIARDMHPLMLVDLFLDEPPDGPGRVCLHDYVGIIKWGGTDYQGVGGLGSVEDLEEADEMSNISLKLNLSGIDDTIIQAALGSDYYRRRIMLCTAFLHQVTARLLTPVQPIWQGYIDILEIHVENDEKRITLTAENEDVDFERPNGSLYSHAQQIKRYPPIGVEGQPGYIPGDTGLQYLESLERADIRWPSERTRTLGVTKPTLDKAITRGPS